MFLDAGGRRAEAGAVRARLRSNLDHRPERRPARSQCRHRQRTVQQGGSKTRRAHRRWHRLIRQTRSRQNGCGGCLCPARLRSVGSVAPAPSSSGGLQRRENWPACEFPRATTHLRDASIAGGCLSSGNCRGPRPYRHPDDGAALRAPRPLPRRSGDPGDDAEARSGRAKPSQAKPSQAVALMPASWEV
jgi:hypothetical protein